MIFTFNKTDENNKIEEKKLNKNMEATIQKYDPFDTAALERERLKLSEEAKRITKPLLDDMRKYREQLNNENNTVNGRVVRANPFKI